MIVGLSKNLFGPRVPIFPGKMGAPYIFSVVRILNLEQAPRHLRSHIPTCNKSIKWNKQVYNCHHSQ